MVENKDKGDGKTKGGKPAGKADASGTPKPKTSKKAVIATVEKADGEKDKATGQKRTLPQSRDDLLKVLEGMKAGGKKPKTGKEAREVCIEEEEEGQEDDSEVEEDEEEIE